MTSLLAPLALAFVPTFPATPTATPLDEKPSVTSVAPIDPLFGQGPSVSLATGVPFLAMGEAAFGFGDRFTAGALLGVTPYVLGVGVRPRVRIAEEGRDRLQVVVPLLYYPQTSSGAPWVLGRPSIELSHRVGGDGARFGGGLGFVAAAPTVSSARPYGDAPARLTFWNTLGVHGALPLAKHTLLIAEATLVLRGARLAGREWVGGPPFALSLGVTTNAF